MDIEDVMTSRPTRRRSTPPTTPGATGRGPRRTPRPSRAGPLPRRIRVPELAVGLIVIGVSILAALLWSRSLTATTDVVIAARSIPRGDILERSDFITADVRGADALGLVSSADVSHLVGRVSLVRLPRGAPVIESMVAALPPIGDADAIVGVALEPGEAPADLAVGDVVRAVVLPDPALLDAPRPVLLDGTALVRGIEPVDEFESRVVVTLGVSLAQATDVAAAHALRLVRVGS